MSQGYGSSIGFMLHISSSAAVLPLHPNLRSAKYGRARRDLSGKTFLVTGSTDGIGKHTALKLADAGADVLVHGRSNTLTWFPKSILWQ